MSLFALAAATMLTITQDGVPISTQVLPVDESKCAKMALDITLGAPRRGPVVSATCKVLVVDEPEKPASAPPAPKKE